MYFVKKIQLQQFRNTNTLSGVGIGKEGQEVLSTRGEKVEREGGKAGGREGGRE